VSDELNSDARRLVDLAREARTPGERDKLRIAERLAVPLAAGAAVGGAVSAAKAAAAGGELLAAGAKAGGSALFAGWTAKLIAIAAVGAAAGAVVLSQQAPERPPQTPSALAPQATPPSRPEALAPAPAEPPTEAAREATSSEQTVQPKPGGLSPTRSATPAHELAEEAALLHRAQAAWRAGQSAQALELANQHAQRFPRSQLASERDVLRVLSLCKLGQTRAAKPIGARLLQKSKGSPWYQSVAESCAGQ
jgi:hypothetical protein